MDKTATSRVIKRVAQGISKRAADGLTKTGIEDYMSFVHGFKPGFTRPSTAPINPLSRKAFMMGQLDRITLRNIGDGEEWVWKAVNPIMYRNIASATLDRDTSRFAGMDIPLADRQKFLDKPVFRNWAQRIEYEKRLKEIEPDPVYAIEESSNLISPTATDIWLQHAGPNRPNGAGPYLPGKSPAELYRKEYRKEYNLKDE